MFGYDAPYSRGTTTPGSVSPNVARDRDWTVTGLLLLVIGFALGWIPYISVVGGLLALVGIILVFLGRRGYGPLHRRYVVIGAALLILALLADFTLSISFVLGIVSLTPPSPGSNLSSLGAAITADLATLVIGTAVLGVLASLSRVIMVYALADHAARNLLWLGFITGTVLSVVVFVIVWPEIATAVSQATSGTTFNVGPLNQLETTLDLLGLTGVVPSALFAWAYFRCRARALSDAGALPA